MAMDGDLPEGTARQAESAAPVNPAPRIFRAGQLDDFLPAPDADTLLAFAIANEDRFRPSIVNTASGLGGIDRTIRRSFDFRGPNAEWAGALGAAILERNTEIARAAGVPPFAAGELELSLTAYRTGSFYRRHFDGAFGPGRKGAGLGRALTVVYYLVREPRRFSGGELELFPLAETGEPQRLTPAHNRLVAFPTFAPHQVTEVTVPGDAFADARFAVNCWIRRASD